jgi:hypothetical protein
MGAAASAVFRRKNHNVFIDGITISDPQIAAVRDSWQLIKGSQGKVGHGARRVGELAFIGLFQEAPETFALFATFSSIVDWRSSKQYLHHCSTVVKVIGHVVEILLDPPLLDR